jgi:hypothetical protein
VELKNYAASPTVQRKSFEFDRRKSRDTRTLVTLSKDTVRNNEIDVISYSKAVRKKTLGDTIENTLVSDLYKLLLQF